VYVNTDDVFVDSCAAVYKSHSLSYFPV